MEKRRMQSDVGTKKFEQTNYCDATVLAYEG